MLTGVYRSVKTLPHLEPRRALPRTDQQRTFSPRRLLKLHKSSTPAEELQKPPQAIPPPRDRRAKNIRAQPHHICFGCRVSVHFRTLPYICFQFLRYMHPLTSDLPPQLNALPTSHLPPTTLSLKRKSGTPNLGLGTSRPKIAAKTLGGPWKTQAQAQANRIMCESKCETLLCCCTLN